MADEPENLVLEMLRRLDTKVDRLDSKVDRLTAGQRLHSRTLDVLRQDMRMMRTAVNDMARENVTPGEMEVVHDDLTQMRSEVDDLTVRLEVIEARQKDH